MKAHINFTNTINPIPNLGGNDASVSSGTLTWIMQKKAELPTTAWLREVGMTEHDVIVLVSLPATQGMCGVYDAVERREKREMIQLEGRRRRGFLLLYQYWEVLGWSWVIVHHSLCPVIWGSQPAGEGDGHRWMSREIESQPRRVGWLSLAPLQDKHSLHCMAAGL